MPKQCLCVWCVCVIHLAYWYGLLVGAAIAAGVCALAGDAAATGLPAPKGKLSRCDVVVLRCGAWGGSPSCV